jgi:hypothetical protein
LENYYLQAYAINLLCNYSTAFGMAGSEAQCVTTAERDPPGVITTHEPRSVRHPTVTRSSRPHHGRPKQTSTGFISGGCRFPLAIFHRFRFVVVISFSCGA